MAHHAPFAIVYLGLIEDPRHIEAMGLPGLRIFIRLLGIPGAATRGEVRVSLRSLSRWLHMDRRLVFRYFERLVERGYLVDSGRKEGADRVYRITRPFEGQELQREERALRARVDREDQALEDEREARHERAEEPSGEEDDGACFGAENEGESWSRNGDHRSPFPEVETATTGRPLGARPKGDHKSPKRRPPVATIRGGKKEPPPCVRAGARAREALGANDPLPEPGSDPGVPTPEAIGSGVLAEVVAGLEAEASASSGVLGEAYPMPDDAAVAFWRWANAGSAADPIDALFQRRAKLAPALWRAWQAYPRIEVWQRAFADSVVGRAAGQVRAPLAALEAVLATAAAALDRTSAAAARAAAPHASGCHVFGCQRPAAERDASGQLWCQRHAELARERGATPEGGFEPLAEASESAQGALERSGSRVESSRREISRPGARGGPPPPSPRNGARARAP